MRRVRVSEEGDGTRLHAVAIKRVSGAPACDFIGSPRVGRIPKREAQLCVVVAWRVFWHVASLSCFSVADCQKRFLCPPLAKSHMHSRVLPSNTRG
jgi:hypothetical protein